MRPGGLTLPSGGACSGRTKLLNWLLPFRSLDKIRYISHLLLAPSVSCQRAVSAPASFHMELLDAQLRDDPAAVRLRVPRQLAAALDGSVDRQSVERAPLAWCLVALQYNKATVAKVFKLLCASGRVAQCGAIVAAAAHQPEEVTVRKSLMLLLRACCVQAHEEAEAGVRGSCGGGAAVARRIVCAVAQQLSLDQART